MATKKSKAKKPDPYLDEELIELSKMSDDDLKKFVDIIYETLLAIHRKRGKAKLYASLKRLQERGPCTDDTISLSHNLEMSLSTLWAILEVKKGNL